MDTLRKNFITVLFLIGALIVDLLPDSSYNRVIFLDIGQGDASLIQYEGLNILVDGGPADYLTFALPRYMSVDDSKIDILIVSHPHADHISGILDIVDRYEIGEVWINPVCFNSSLYRLLLDLDLKIKPVNNLHELRYKDMVIQILHPFAAEARPSDCKGSVGSLNPTDKNVNNDSIVFLLEVAGKKLLFVGDAEAELEKKLLEEGSLEDIDLLKAGHHCSRSSSTEAFLTVTKPETAICSFASENSYGHPSPEALSRLANVDAKVLSTANKKSIVIGL
ncbi:MAG: MBL fold metallo-hydrolase [Candidatus Dojkabacteria bacterium]|nr:MAG: MBL fold metallo-hydrolase [Candidatus Dojkabacteria bacterium]